MENKYGKWVRKNMKKLFANMGEIWMKKGLMANSLFRTYLFHYLVIKQVDTLLFMAIASTASIYINP